MVTFPPVWRQIDEANAFGNTALHIACFNGQDAVVSELIDYGANVSQPNNKGFTPLHFAAASTHGALCLEFLVNNGADVNVQVYLFIKGGEIDSVDKDGNTPLHVAARYGHELLINTLITSGADCTRTPLHYAAASRHFQCLETLVACGIDINATDQWGRSALHYAAASDLDRRTPLMLAVAGGHVDAVSLLLEREASVNLADNHGLTALHLGEECVQCLLEQEASVLLGDSRGRTAIHLAAARGHASWLSELLSIACSESPSLPPLRDHSGYTPLHWACYYG
ncbi:hypothetical protein GOODEAATRI_002364 [Goodea atripinnis]|uniref:Ankyrin repeat domain 44 n=1 Tax=Goodea atripinnis TaxID=208336 RepID=A0ABV0PUL8_9TELE